MELKNYEVRVALNVVNQLLSTPLPFRAKLIVSRNKKELAEIVEVLDTAMQELIDQYAERDEEGHYVQPRDDKGEPVPNQVSIRKDDVQEFNDKMVALNNEVVDVDVTPIQVNDEVEGALSALVDLDPTPVLWLFE
jgi:ERCC4-type nuclease